MGNIQNFLIKVHRYMCTHALFSVHLPFSAPHSIWLDFRITVKEIFSDRRRKYHWTEDFEYIGFNFPLPDPDGLKQVRFWHEIWLEKYKNETEHSSLHSQLASGTLNLRTGGNNGRSEDYYRIMKRLIVIRACPWTNCFLLTMKRVFDAP